MIYLMYLVVFTRPSGATTSRLISATSEAHAAAIWRTMYDPQVFTLVSVKRDVPAKRKDRTR